MKNFIGIKLSRLFCILSMAVVLSFVIAYVSPKLPGIESSWKFWITGLPLALLILLMFVNAIFIIVRSSLSRDISQVIGITLICLAIFVILSDNFSLKSLVLGSSVGGTVYIWGRKFLDFGSGRGKPPKLLSGEEFSKESLRNYLLLFLIGIGFFLLLSYL